MKSSTVIFLGLLWVLIPQTDVMAEQAYGQNYHDVQYQTDYDTDYDMTGETSNEGEGVGVSDDNGLPADPPADLPEEVPLPGIVWMLLAAAGYGAHRIRKEKDEVDSFA